MARRNIIIINKLFSIEDFIKRNGWIPEFVHKQHKIGFKRSKNGRFAKFIKRTIFQQKFRI